MNLDGPPQRASPSEAAIVTAIIKEIRRRGGVVVKTTGITTTGISDLLGCYRGRALAWEIKTPTGRVAPLQIHHVRAWQQAGASAHIVRSVAHARALLDEIDAAHTNHE